MLLLWLLKGYWNLPACPLSAWPMESGGRPTIFSTINLLSARLNSIIICAWTADQRTANK